MLYVKCNNLSDRVHAGISAGGAKNGYALIGAQDRRERRFYTGLNGSIRTATLYLVTSETRAIVL